MMVISSFVPITLSLLADSKSSGCLLRTVEGSWLSLQKLLPGMLESRSRSQPQLFVQWDKGWMGWMGWMQSFNIIKVH